MTLLSQPPTSLQVDVRVRAIDETRLLDRIRSEFLEMPGLDLTLPQAQRLWGLNRLTCEYLCGRLLEEGFLEYTGRRTYVLREGRGVHQSTTPTHQH